MDIVGALGPTPNLHDIVSIDSQYGITLDTTGTNAGPGGALLIERL